MVQKEAFSMARTESTTVLDPEIEESDATSDEAIETEGDEAEETEDEQPETPPPAKKRRKSPTTGRTKKKSWQPPPSAKMRPPSNAPSDQDGADPDEDFWIWLSGFSPDQWANLICYLWRCEPITDIARGGKPTSICKFAAPFSLDTILNQEGSGIYRIDVVQIDPITTVQRRIRQHYCSLLNMEFPPRVPLGAWKDDPRNSMWKAFIPAMQQREEGNKPAFSPTDTASLFQTIFNAVHTIRGDHADNAQMTAALVGMVQQNQNAMMALMDPAKQLATTRALLKELAPAPDTSSSLVIQILRDELKATREEVRQLRDRPAPDPFETFQKMIPTIKDFAGALGMTGGTGGGGGGRSNPNELWAGVVERVIDGVPAIIAEVREWRATAPPVAGAPTPATPPPGRTGPSWPIGTPTAEQPKPPTAAAPPAAAPQHTNGSAAAAAPVTDPPAQPAQKPTPAPGATGEPTPEQIEQERLYQLEMAKKWGHIMTHSATFMVDFFRRNQTGYAFRDWFTDAHGQLAWGTMREEIGPLRLVDMVSQHPQLKHVIRPAEASLQFMSEFFTLPGEEPDDDVEIIGREEGEGDKPVNIRTLVGKPS
jgi:hypothetical protein